MDVKKGMTAENCPFSLRPCHRDDLPALAGIEASCFPGEPVLPLITFVQYFELFAPFFAIAENEEKRIIAFGIAAPVADDPKTAWWLDCCVLPEYQSKGIAKRIGEWLIQKLRKQGCEFLKATVSPKNIPSQKLLTRLGFKTTDRIPDYFGPGEDRLVVELGVKGVKMGEV